MTHNLADAFTALASRWPARPAVLSPDTSLTFSQLVDRAARIAELLKRRGIGTGDRVGIAQTNTTQAFLLMLGAWLCGATALVIDFRTRAPERKKLADSLDLKFFVEDRPGPGAGSYEAVRSDGAWAEEEARASPSTVPVTALDNPIAVIGVSSGTSGLPQPVALSHSCLYTRAALVVTSPQWVRASRLIVTAPLSFTATRMNVLSCLLDGGCVYFAPILISSEQLAESLLRTQATAMLTVPATVRGLMGLAGSVTPLFPAMQYLMCCGAPMAAAEKVAARQALTPGFLENYGSTMAGMLALLESKDIEAHGNSVGRPLPHVRVQIVDGQDRPLPAGEVGAIRARTPGVGEPMSLGSGADERTSDLLIDGWIYPGDLGTLGDDGFLKIVGRSSDMIIRGGAKVYPSEVEGVLAEHAAVAEVAVVGWPDQKLGEEVAAFVVLRTSAQPQDILAYCRSKLHPDKQPRQVFIIEALPRNANGKLVKRELIDLLPPR
jgi:acyl-CoA synthetase (AMP-forming)/AMP-acid ligase II